jgi:hypothetical protein
MKVQIPMHQQINRRDRTRVEHRQAKPKRKHPQQPQIQWRKKSPKLVVVVVRKMPKKSYRKKSINLFHQIVQRQQQQQPRRQMNKG